MPGQLLVEAESFQNPGGWSLDTQFIEIMGSPYLLAHGLGKPVKDEVEVLAGLQDGDRLVARPAGLELDGKQIEAQWDTNCRCHNGDYRHQWRPDIEDLNSIYGAPMKQCLNVKNEIHDLRKRKQGANQASVDDQFRPNITRLCHRQMRSSDIGL